MSSFISCHPLFYNEFVGAATAKDETYDEGSNESDVDYNALNESAIIVHVGRFAFEMIKEESSGVEVVVVSDNAVNISVPNAAP
eukprot:14022690-Ditylum_brightwellii.AAC.1